MKKSIYDYITSLSNEELITIIKDTLEMRKIGVLNKDSLVLSITKEMSTELGIDYPIAFSLVRETAFEIAAIKFIELNS